eukprot:4062111-Amphidinium_carterae.1
MPGKLMRAVSQQPKLDQIVIADAYLEKIDACKTGRVYLLRSTSHDLKRFFWMQETHVRTCTIECVLKGGEITVHSQAVAALFS